ncbi:hypothetical protein BIV23_08415 [Streptomyces monashensis]|uniref:Uncharacterized protein n=1 Tax=Streptomyces monashensis TaxID=1678012 RepID=A0A1S2QJY8_9ACTN|nr:hypothetical protein BIV23_08415 [Streptomyces monashensis]
MGVWSPLRRGPLANTALTDDEHLERTLRRGLRHIQLRPDLIGGCLADTGLTLIHQPTPPACGRRRRGSVPCHRASTAAGAFAAVLVSAVALPTAAPSSRRPRVRAGVQLHGG